MPEPVDQVTTVGHDGLGCHHCQAEGAKAKEKEEDERAHGYLGVEGSSLEQLNLAENRDFVNYLAAKLSLAQDPLF